MHLSSFQMCVSRQSAQPHNTKSHDPNATGLISCSAFHVTQNLNASGHKLQFKYCQLQAATTNTKFMGTRCTETTTVTAPCFSSVKQRAVTGVVPMPRLGLEL